MLLISCNQEGHYQCPARLQACRKCSGSGDSRYRGDKGSKAADGGRRNTGSRQGDGRGRRRCATWQETNLVADGNHSYKGRTLKLCTGMGRGTLLMHYLV